MDILDSLRQAPSAELYRLYLAIGKMLDDPRRILEYVNACPGDGRQLHRRQPAWAAGERHHS